MEIAKIILEYLKTLIWPVFLVWLVFMFRSEVVQFFRRLTEGKEYEFEIAGQKLKVSLLEKAIKTISQEIKDTESNVAGEIAPDSNKLNKLLIKTADIADLTDLQIRFLSKFYATDRVPIQSVSSYYDKAIQGLLIRGVVAEAKISKEYILTAEGRELLEWIMRAES